MHVGEGVVPGNANDVVAGELLRGQVEPLLHIVLGPGKGLQPHGAGQFHELPVFIGVGSGQHHGMHALYQGRAFQNVVQQRFSGQVGQGLTFKAR